MGAHSGHECVSPLDCGPHKAQRQASEAFVVPALSRQHPTPRKGVRIDVHTTFFRVEERRRLSALPVDFIRGLALAIGFPEALCSSSSMVSVVSVTYFSTPFTTRTQEAGSVLKQRSDLSFNALTVFMMKT